MDPADSAQRALNAVARNRAIILAARWKLLWWLNRLSPVFMLWLSQRSFPWTKRRLAAVSTPRQGA